MAEFAACDTCTEVEIADTDGVVLDGVGEVIISLGHGSNENGYALIFVQTLHVISHSHDFGVEAERNFPTIRGKVVRDRVLDDLDELLLGRCRADLVSVEQLDH
jgi:hypothetical protein